MENNLKFGLSLAVFEVINHQSFFLVIGQVAGDGLRIDL